MGTWWRLLLWIQFTAITTQPRAGPCGIALHWLMMSSQPQWYYRARRYRAMDNIQKDLSQMPLCLLLLFCSWYRKRESLWTAISISYLNDLPCINSPGHFFIEGFNPFVWDWTSYIIEVLDIMTHYENQLQPPTHTTTGSLSIPSNMTQISAPTGGWRSTRPHT